MQNTMTRGFCAFVACIQIGTASPVSAQQADERFGNWLFTCAEGPCQGYFNVKDPEKDEIALSLGLLRDTGKDQATLIITLPKMTALRPGSELRLTGLEPLPVPFEFCNDGGCTGFAPLTSEQVTTLQNAPTADVRFFRYGASKPNSYTVPIDGFAEVYERLGQP